ncbi:MAG: hypothetical protein ACFCD0_04615 [Gemmataceae bacterium]
MSQRLFRIRKDASSLDAIPNHKSTKAGRFPELISPTSTTHMDRENHHKKDQGNE